MDVVEGESPNLDLALVKLESDATRLSEHLRSINDPEQQGHLSEVSRFCRLVMEVVGSPREEIRENLISIYNLASRPIVDDEEIQFSHLLLDKLINDVRDDLLAAELAAEADGAPAPMKTNPAQTGILIPTAEIGQEVLDLKAQLSTIQSEIYGIKVGGIQAGFINIQVEKIEMKLHLAEAILALRKFIDGLNLEKNLLGIKSAARGLLGWLQDKSLAAYVPMSAAVKGIIDASATALRSVGGLISRYRANSRDDEIWSESEVSDLISKGKNIPISAAPFVRNLSIASGYNDKIVDLSELSKLTELRSLSISFVKNVSELYKLSSLSKLKKLSLNVHGLCDFGWINDLASLEELSIRGLSRSGTRLNFPDVVELSRLRSIDLTLCMMGNFPEVSSGVINLSMYGCDPDSLTNIGKISDLRTLALRKMDIFDFSFLMGLDELEELDLRESEISDALYLNHLHGLKRIHVSRSLFSKRLINQVRMGVGIFGDHGGTIRQSRR